MQRSLAGRAPGLCHFRSLRLCASAVTVAIGLGAATGAAAQQAVPACSSGVVATGWNDEPASLVLADSIARWVAEGTGRAAVARLRGYPLPAAHSRVVEGHAILRALVVLNYDLEAQSKLTGILHEEISAARLSIPEVPTADVGPDAFRALVAGALGGLPDESVSSSGGRQRSSAGG